MFIVLKADVHAKSDIQRNGVAVVHVFRVYSGEIFALDGEQVLCAEVEAQALHADFLRPCFRYVVAYLQITQFQELTVLHIIGGYAFLVVTVVTGKRRNVGTGIGGRPGIEYAFTFVQEADVEAAPQVGLFL